MIFCHNKADLKKAVERLSLFPKSDLKHKNLDNLKAIRVITDKLKYYEVGARGLPEELVDEERRRQLMLFKVFIYLLIQSV